MSVDTMNLLIVTNNPNRASFRQRIGIYTDILHSNGINCEVACFPSSSSARRKLFKRSLDFDAVFLHKKRLNFLDAFWLRRYGRIIIYDFDDAVMYNDKNPNKLARKRQKSFERTVKLADMVIAGNAYLAEHARKFSPYVEILPTGLDTRSYKLRFKPQNDNRIRLVWIGSKSTLKYLADIKPALEEIGTRFDNVVLRMICDDFFDLQNMTAEKHRWSLKTQAVDLAVGDIGLAPLPDNCFTRGKCGFKILQYAATALPVIASPVGANSDYVKNGTTGILAADPQQWINAIIHLVENLKLRKKMGAENLAFAKDFDVRLIGEKLARLITKCIQNRIS